jgi:hypothetical protein
MEGLFAEACRLWQVHRRQGLTVREGPAVDGCRRREVRRGQRS